MTLERSFNTWDWQKEIHRRCNAAGVSFRFDPKIQTASTDGSVILVPTPPENATKQDYEILRAYVIHECGHILRPDAFKVIKEYGLTPKHPLFMIFNQLEDRIQEWEATKGLRGDAEMIDQLHAVNNEKFTVTALDWKFDEPLSRSFTMRLSASMHLSLESAVDWMPRTARVQSDVMATYEKLFGTEGVTLVNTLISEGWVDRIKAHRGQSPHTVFKLASELYTRLFPELPPPPKQGKATQAKANAANAEEGISADAQNVMGKLPWEALLRSSHEGADGSTTGGCPVTIDWSGKPRNKLPPIWFSNVSVNPPTCIASEAAPVLPFALIGDVRRELQAKKKVRVTREKLHGRLDKRNLTRLVMPQVGDGTYNRSVFQQLSPGLKLDTAVTILFDCSGSMRGEKFEAATKAALSLYDLCAVALRLPCEVLGFTHSMHGNSVVIYECKSYKDTRPKRNELYGKLRGAGARMQGNSDGDALMTAFVRQQRLRNSRKVIIVLSDGCPVEAGNGDGDATLRAAIAEIRSKGTELYGIGIMDNNVRRYYSKKAPVVNKAEDVPNALLEVLRDVLQRQLDAA